MVLAMAGATATFAAEGIYEVGLIGDAGRSTLLTEIADQSKTKVAQAGDTSSVEVRMGKNVVRFRTAAKPDAKATEGVIRQANLLLVVVDATQGPLPIHREQLKLAKDAGAAKAGVVYTNCKMVDDAELMELQIMELRALLKDFGLKGDDAPIFFDFAQAKTKHIKGIDAMLKKIDEMASAPK